MASVQQPSPDPPRRRGAAWRIAAAAVLVLGLLAAGGVWIAADDGDDGTGPADVTGRIAHSHMDATAGALARDRQDERIGGAALVRTVAFDRWLGSLWHGRRLAVTLAVAAIVAAAACAWVAGLMDAEVDGD